MPRVPELGGIDMNEEKNVSGKLFEVPWIAIIVVSAIALFVVIQIDHLVQKNFEDPVESVVEFVDVEVPVYGCPLDFNVVIQTTCVEFGGLVSPVTQESLEEIQNNGGVCEQQEDSVVCQPCLGVENIGWTCIDSKYLENEA